MLPPQIIDGVNNGGNRTCEEAATAMGVESFEFSSDRVNYENDAFDKSFPEGVNITTDGTSVSWSITPRPGYCVANVAVIVKGSSDAHVYMYNDGTSSDSNLASPINSSNGNAGLSNLTICWNEVACEDSEGCSMSMGYYFNSPVSVWSSVTVGDYTINYEDRGNYSANTHHALMQAATIILSSATVAETASVWADVAVVQAWYTGNSTHPSGGKTATAAEKAVRDAGGNIGNWVDANHCED